MGSTARASYPRWRIFAARLAVIFLASMLMTVLVNALHCARHPLVALAVTMTLTQQTEWIPWVLPFN